MSEVEKLYKKAKVKPVCDGLDCFTCTAKCNNGKYPEFTAEKQIELIKWLIQKNFYDERIIRSNFEKTYFYCSYIDDYCESAYFDKFEEALANVFNYFWQDLTEQERTEIKEILRG